MLSIKFSKHFWMHTSNQSSCLGTKLDVELRPQFHWKKTSCWHFFWHLKKPLVITCLLTGDIYCLNLFSKVPFEEMFGKDLLGMKILFSTLCICCQLTLPIKNQVHFTRSLTWSPLRLLFPPQLQKPKMWTGNHLAF